MLLWPQSDYVHIICLQSFEWSIVFSTRGTVVSGFTPFGCAFCHVAACVGNDTRYDKGSLSADNQTTAGSREAFYNFNLSTVCKCWKRHYRTFYTRD